MSASIEQQVLEQFSSSEQSRLESIKSDLKRQEYLLSRALMRHALSEQFRQPTQHWAFIEKQDSAPVISNLPDGFWLSLSHSHGTICFVLHQNPIGIDIEQGKARANFSALARQFMNEDELELLHSNQQPESDTFYKIWCAKEAFYKMASPPEQAGLYLKKIDYFALAQGKKHHLAHGKIKGFHLTLVSNSKLTAINQLPARTFNGSIQIQWA